MLLNKLQDRVLDIFASIFSKPTGLTLNLIGFCPVNKISNAIIITLIGVITLSCNQHKIYDDYVEIDNSIWQEDTLASFEFTVPSDSINYSISYNVRYAEGYPFYNLYLTYYLEDSLQTPISSELQEIILFNKKTGEPLGDGLGGVFDREVLIFNNMKFPYVGKYHFKIKQFMRIKELPGIISFGIKIEKKN